MRANGVKDGLRAMACTLLARNTVLRTPISTLGRMGVLPAAVWKRLPVEGLIEVPVPNGSTFRYTATARDSIARALCWTGLDGFEPETVQAFSSIAPHVAFMLDIGANTGIYTLLGCALSEQLHVAAFEPVPRIHALLARNVEMNGWQDRCELHCEACGARTGTASFHVPFGDVPTSASLHPEGFRSNPGELIHVPIVTVDAVFGDKERVDLVKIDVEGFEDQVLEGMRATIKRFSPTIIVECNPDGPFAAVDALLSRCGYRFYHLRRDGPVPMTRIQPDPAERFRNYLCVSKDRTDDYPSLLEHSDVRN